jgi:hypothetical protein
MRLPRSQAAGERAPSAVNIAGAAVADVDMVATTTGSDAALVLRHPNPGRRGWQRSRPIRRSVELARAPWSTLNSAVASAAAVARATPTPELVLALGTPLP